MNSGRDPTSRLRAGLNPLLTTSLGAYPSQANTPLSAVSTAYSSHNAFSSAQTPVSAIQPYNPQEWISSPIAGPERSHGLSPDSQASPPPPPPYSPPRSQRPMSMNFESPVANISAARAPPPNHLRPSPEPSTSTSFPPPPGTNGRGSSRERRFGLPIGRRREPEQAVTPPDPHPPVIHAPSAITSSRPHHPGPLTIQIPQQVPQRAGSGSSQGLPPGARRAASTSALDTPTSARSRSASQSRWEPGMPLPPPPPGPPPSAARSQSVNRPTTSEPVMSPPTRRPPPTGVAALGPVPPTPADWVDNEPPNQAARGRESQDHQPLALETSNVDNAGVAAESANSGGSPGGGLARTNAVRGEKTLRERRNESRTRSSRLSLDASMIAAESQPLSDIVVPPASTGLSRRLTISKSTPRSGGRQETTPRTSDVAPVEGHHDSRGSTPRPLGSAQTHHNAESPTPPFSPYLHKAHHVADGPGPSTIAPKALPTPPPQARSASSSQTRMSLEAVVPAPLSPRGQVTKEAVIKQTADQFCRGTIDRFRAFAQKEALANNDAEKVRLFAEFIVSESRVRRERYSSAIGAMGSEIFDLTRDLFRPMVNRRESTASQASEWTPQSSEPRSHRGSMGSVSRGEPSGHSNSAPSSAGVPVSPVGGPPNNVNWNTNFHPSLSPILSMSVSERNDESDSRGRPASRWWESDSIGDGSTKLERTKRESKYMGVPKEAREALQWVDNPSPVPGPSKRDSSNEYPPEKQGWHEQEQVVTPQPLRTSLHAALSGPNTPNPAHLDVSRLVTLPPPYPRHHPAVNNNHPELTAIRASVRTISDLSEVEATKSRFIRESKAMRDEAADAASKRRQALRANLSQEVSLGNMTYAEAAAIEADSNEAENGSLKDLEKKDFDRFQTAVVMPLNELLTARISKATALFDELRGRLFVETREPNPNMPQEEGDEQPELLEKLTLLKWIFEAREMLHRAIYDLLSDRNDRYRNVIIIPYRLAGNEEKVAEATAFFTDDANKRALTFSQDVFRRTREFREVVEENVVRGVEVQLSAFWDIAPPLKRLLDKIPLDLQGFHIQIPHSELLENPSYHDHPLQYLFSLLLHAEKSTYQFIESQTNLLCLLHEVKEAVVSCKARVMECDGRDAQQVEHMKTEEGQRLTDDLKEKVRVVQDQWRSALGETIGGVKERAGEWLLETGGWDESLEDRGVGSL